MRHKMGQPERLKHEFGENCGKRPHDARSTCRHDWVCVTPVYLIDLWGYRYLCQKCNKVEVGPLL